MEAALKIQKNYRRYRQLKIEAEARKKKEEMNKLMEEVVIIIDFTFLINFIKDHALIWLGRTSSLAEND